MPKSTAWQSDLLKLLFQNIGAANIGDATGLLPSGVSGNLYVSLHTADPTEAGNQGSNETSYTGYARVAVVRSTSGWVVSGASPTAVNPFANITWPLCTAGVQTITHFGVGTSISGAGKLLYSGAVLPTITTGPGVIPQLTTLTNITEE